MNRPESRQSRRANERARKKIEKKEGLSRSFLRQAILPAFLLIGSVGVGYYLYQSQLNTGSTNIESLAQKLDRFDQELTSNPLNAPQIASEISGDMAKLYCEGLDNCNPENLRRRVTFLDHDEYQRLNNEPSCKKQAPRGLTLAFGLINKDEVYIDLERTLTDDLRSINSEEPSKATRLAAVLLHEHTHSGTILAPADETDRITDGKTGSTIRPQSYRGFTAFLNDSLNSLPGKTCITSYRTQLEESAAQYFTEERLREAGVDSKARTHNRWVDFFRDQVLNRYYNGEYRQVLVNFHRPSKPLAFFKDLGRRMGFNESEAQKNGENYLAGNLVGS